MSVTPMTPTELEDLTILRIKVGAVGQNAVVYPDGTIEHFPNSEMVKNCVFQITEASATSD